MSRWFRSYGFAAVLDDLLVGAYPLDSGDVGLLSEEYDPQTRRLTGNIPQTLSHAALVNAARRLGTVAAEGGEYGHP